MHLNGVEVRCEALCYTQSKESRNEGQYPWEKGSMIPACRRHMESRAFDE